MEDIMPILRLILPFDAENGASIYYNYTGSKQTVENNLVIFNIDSGLYVYDYSFETFEKIHYIPPNILENGKSYRAKIRVRFSDGTYSPFSNELQFKTFKMPVLDIESIDGQGYVYNSDITFKASYYQANGEPVKYYQFSLYDENEDLIAKYSRRTPVDAYNFTELISGLERGKGYFIECKIETINGVIYEHRERFIPMYIVPSVNGVISTMNDSDNGFVRITTNIKQIIGTNVQSESKLKQNTDGVILDGYDYIDDEWIIIPKENPVIFKGLEMNRASDFVMKIWCKGIPDGTKFMELSHEGSGGMSIDLWKESDRVFATKKLGSHTAIYSSNIVEIHSSVEFMLYMKVIEHRIDLSITLI